MSNAPIRYLLTWSSKFVDGTRPSFKVRASFDQYLALVVVAGICLTSFLVWPEYSHPLYHIVKYSLILLTLLLFARQFWLLRHWVLSFVLTQQGDGLLFLDTHIASGRVQAQDAQPFDYTPINRHFKLTSRRYVTSMVCCFEIALDPDDDIVNTRDKQWLMVWRDMLDDTSYRHLCRLLLTSSPSKVD